MQHLVKSFAEGLCDSDIAKPVSTWRAWLKLKEHEKQEEQKKERVNREKGLSEALEKLEAERGA